MQTVPLGVVCVVVVGVSRCSAMVALHHAESGLQAAVDPGAGAPGHHVRTPGQDARLRRVRVLPRREDGRRRHGRRVGRPRPGLLPGELLFLKEAELIFAFNYSRIDISLSE